MAQTLLVTGIHREELSFGDRVVEQLDEERIQILRIPQGISHARPGSDSLFYYNTQHREIYLQLWQQVKGRYRLMLDLHCGLNDAGHCADLYSRDERLLQRIAARSKQVGIEGKIRLAKILKDTEEIKANKADGQSVIGARTPIPESLWNDQVPIYVGMEIYLIKEGEGSAEDWLFARDLIELVQACA